MTMPQNLEEYLKFFRVLTDTEQDPSEISFRFFQDFQTNKIVFEQLVKSDLSTNDLIRIFKLVSSLAKSPDELINHIMEYVLCDEFFDSIIKYLKLLNNQYNNNYFRILVEFYEVVVNHLPACDNAFSKISALLHMTCESMNAPTGEVHDILLRLRDLLEDVEGKKYLQDGKSVLYTDVEIFPSPFNLFESRNLTPNIICGPYEDSEQYLDIHFKLLREDYVCSVKEGLTTIKNENLSGLYKNNSNFYLYRNVRSTRLFLPKNPSSKICHRLQFSPQDNYILKNEDWSVCKKFMNGSLLFFTQNNFTTFFVATVEANIMSFKKGCRSGINISVVGNPYQLKIGLVYDMVEPRTFFEPYYQSLKVLQLMNPYDFPLADDILSVCNKIVPSPFVAASLSPTECFSYEGDDLNEPQKEALNAAISHKFTLIQGPPGTGKTYLSRKIISILAEDTSDARPILVICMRNRALDNILEPLAKYGLNIVRFGWTKNECLKSVSFYNRKKKWKPNKTANARFLRKTIASFRSVINKEWFINNPQAVEETSECHRRACEAYRLLYDYYSAHKLLSSKVQVIGATVTGATKRNGLLSQINPKAVLIEEAGEILESCLLSCLPLPCDHLILVGDHLQLPPATSWHNSSVKYNLNVSLFERLVKNKKSYHRLTIQHRMRPEISALVCPLIYDDLINHPCVSVYPDVRGVDKNVYFFSHSSSEEFAAKSLSFKNTEEADFILSFASYLIKQGYSSKDITILAAYSAQQNYLLTNHTSYPLIDGIQIQSIDNYQGDENEIILLSLVRSNGSSIGFLSIPNRINVALTRARTGFYMFGNADTLSYHSDFWDNVFQLLKSRNCFGKTIPLKCKIHGGIKNISTPRELNGLDLTCNSICGQKMECGHICDRLCHGSSLHDKTLCTKPCLRKVCDSHSVYCLNKCNEDCAPCTKMRPVSLSCGHLIYLPCATKVEGYKCKKRCFRKPCGLHQCPRLCYKKCGSCNKKRDYLLECGHTISLKCSTNVVDYKCTFPCRRMSCDRGHPCRKLCYEKCGDCAVLIHGLLTCGHIYRGTCCSLDSINHKCYEPCKRRLNCELRHPCRKLCYEICGPCTVPLNFKLPCGHTFEGICGSVDRKNLKCKQPCNRRGSCGIHLCPRLCHAGLHCPPCEKTVMSEVRCDHIDFVRCSERYYSCGRMVRIKYAKCPHSVTLFCHETYHPRPDLCEECKNQSCCIL